VLSYVKDLYVQGEERELEGRGGAMPAGGRRAGPVTPRIIVKIFS